MTEIQPYFIPLEESLHFPKLEIESHTLGHVIEKNIHEFPIIEQAEIIIIGCNEDQGPSSPLGASLAPDIIRKHLYGLSIPSKFQKIADLGNVVKTDTKQAYYERISYIVNQLIKKDKIVILLGGSQDISYGQYLAYQGKVTELELVNVDSRIDISDSDFGLNNHSFLHKIFLHSPNYLFHFTNLGHQNFLVSSQDRQKLRNLNFSAVRIGELRSNMEMAETVLRHANMVSFDMSAMRSAEAPGTNFPSPAGLTIEEICKIGHYAGKSERVSSICISEVHPLKDFNEQTSFSAALLVWYFLEGLSTRVIEDLKASQRLEKRVVPLPSGNMEIVFLRNKLSEKWWMEVPFTTLGREKEKRIKTIPSNKKEFEMAQNNEIPPRWWLTHLKLR